MRLSEREHNGKCLHTKLSILRTIIISKQRAVAGRSSVLSAQLLGLSLLSVCTALHAAHEYTISVTDDLASMTVTARFDRAVDYVSARSSHATQYLRDVRDCDSGEKIASRGRALVLAKSGIRCLSYTVSLRAADRDANKVVVSPSLWMWRPRLSRNDEILATFSLPHGTRVFVPWQMTDKSGTRYRLVATPQSGTATAIFGNFEQRELRDSGTGIRVVSLAQDKEIDLDDFTDWIRSTVANVEMVYGRFPNPGACVILIPVDSSGWGRDRPVTFGRVVRDGGETIELMINADFPIADFYREWTPTHEFSHLLLPYLDSEQRWISEGFAQYYQNVLLARAGQHSAEEAWQKIHAGLERGRESAPGLSPNDAASGRTRDSRMKIYWSGAALALMADVELRRRSSGTESLDTVLGQLQSCCLPSASSWSGIELFRKLDEQLSTPLFVSLYREYAEADAFPDTRPLMRELGVISENSLVQLDESAPLAVIRDAITRVATTH